MIGASFVAWNTQAAPFIDQQQQHIKSQQSAKEAQLTPDAPDISLNESTPPDADGPFPQETPCFSIDRVRLTGREAFPHWFPAQRIADGAVGHCLGVKGINQLMSRLQNRLVDHGWVTSRVLVPEQDLSKGELTLALVPGMLRHIRYADGSDERAVLFTSVPAREGQLLDLRDIEQGLENQQRLPTVQDSMEIVPGDNPGESDVVITRHQSKLWRVNMWVDNSGTKSTGRSQGGAMLALDNPFALSDLLYVSASHDLGFKGRKQSKNINGHYSVPLGYWLFEVNAGQYNYVQNVAGYNGDIRYSGKSKNLNVGLSRVIQRNASGKTTLRSSVQVREIRNYIDHTEIEVQRRRTSAWLLGLDHRHYIGNATIDGGVSYQRGTRWFGAMPAYEEQYEDGYDATAKSKILTWTAGLNWPFALGNQNFRYQMNYLRQMSTTPLTSPDQLAIGNRWTVRGFDGERTLSASHGWYVQNTLAWQTPLPEQEFYLGADYGEVGGRSDGSTLLGRHLAGGVAGLRGNISALGLSYDAFGGTPLSKPHGFKTDSVTFGFSVSWQY
ncbi:ShlB/FhaC/HecB family hemolysin secretion/activation protein [Pluralibacter gergoviae]|uniref:ShlB/FhaC/HecB family hemolysin secretion/activation protein n=1 Tax=Pluralibacter gergoviae TaxID=61647 RepID=A0A0J5M2Q9_PLUGE|nr:ShlB/FhaC/HecB family hemolysin secretion/activation protein [Pluralibacter gergoviae]AVR02624.1 ShlB/FhaC/HecB family hemolysin secretion/activation protein [Pluralibacter gergoviae]EKW9967804.1 ShlB/FhaC/HecB family hemolysin secretion/activation protein [Pluralibacter gergoviae]KMK04419.1 ShlB/FhaC/HecB family hemolysin secretion/activation protein [Pluralibacter gergoviae]KMK11915.1 ShlB/FhaC/HecB family hemolysin secretion/activation protein [Pluralibacter gergoviae]KMK22368.1 ShlB/Fha